MTRDYWKKQREIEGVSEWGGEKEIRCEEIGKCGGVFIGGNGSISYKKHKCGKKKTCKSGKKKCKLNVENLT